MSGTCDRCGRFTLYSGCVCHIKWGYDRGTFVDYGCSAVIGTSHGGGAPAGKCGVCKGCLAYAASDKRPGKLIKGGGYLR